MASAEVDRLLQEGIAAARAGRSGEARELLLQVIAHDEEVEVAWLWLSGLVEEPTERQICLENVLTLNPGNRAAQAGLHWLLAQHSLPAAVGPRVPDPDPALVALGNSPSNVPTAAAAATALEVELDPFGCPFCGGSLAGDRPLCLICGRSAALRYRKPAAGAGLAWLVALFVMLGVAAWMEGYAVSQVVRLGQLPGVLSETAVRLFVGAALFQPDGVPDHMVELAGVLRLSANVLAGLCVATALGLAFHSRAIYFCAFLLAGLLLAVTGVGLMAGLVGWLPALFLLGLVILALRWLVDGGAAFEWEVRTYNADLDLHLRTDLDYYHAGQRYREMGMWAKAAAHWKVASQLAPSQSQYQIALANGYVRLGYSQAAFLQAEKALARTPDDADLCAFRDSLAQGRKP